MRLMVLALIAAAGVAAGAALAQQKGPEPEAGCEAGFRAFPYPHGSELNFRCRTRVIDCPERQGHHVAVIPEPSFETVRGVQFGYRCQYLSKDR